MASMRPRVIAIQIPVDKIGEVIGPKGKVINLLVRRDDIVTFVLLKPVK